VIAIEARDRRGARNRCFAMQLKANRLAATTGEH